MKAILAICALFLCFFLVGCPPQGDVCVDDGDCQGVPCVEGTCQQAIACLVDAQCPKGQICDEDVARCRLGCRADVDCNKGQQKGQSCYLGRCKEAICGPLSNKNPKDSEPCYTGKADEVKEEIIQKGGQCRKGIHYCIENGQKWSACFKQVLPAVQEICDGKDNNCNGLTDEGLDCGCLVGTWQYCSTLPAGVELGKNEIGLCEKGIQVCQADPNDKSKGSWGACVMQRSPEPTQAKLKACIEVDANCDAKFDSKAACACEEKLQGQTRPCYPADPKTEGKGLCKAGTQTCKKECQAKEPDTEKCVAYIYYWSACVKATLPVPEEVGGCNGKDDDCDGKIDNSSADPSKALREVCYPAPGVAGCKKEEGKWKCVGPCRTGFSSCKDGGGGLCEDAITPVPEKCNGKDDDCNGAIDDFKQGQQSFQHCYSASSGCTQKPDGSYECKGGCKSGVQQCDAGKWGACDGEKGPVAEKKGETSCDDGVDNDCDGKTDADDTDCQ